MNFRPASVPGGRRFRFFRSTSALLLREMTTTYGKSPGGYIWAILEPVAAVALMTFLFSLLLRAPGLGTNFPLFYATGFLPFTMYMQASMSLSTAIRFSNALLAYPAVTFIDALVARFVLAVMTQLIIFFIVVGGIVWFYDIRLVMDWGALFVGISMAVALALGVGIMNCLLVTRFGLWDRIWAVLNRPLFLISAIFFIPENIPTNFRGYLMLNPLAHVTTKVRAGFYGSYEAVHAVPLYVFIISGVLTVFGLLFLMRYHKDIALR